MLFQQTQCGLHHGGGSTALQSESSRRVREVSSRAMAVKEHTAAPEAAATPKFLTKENFFWILVNKIIFTGVNKTIAVGAPGRERHEDIN